MNSCYLCKRYKTNNISENEKTRILDIESNEIMVFNIHTMKKMYDDI